MNNQIIEVEITLSSHVGWQVINPKGNGIRSPFYVKMIWNG